MSETTMIDFHTHILPYMDDGAKDVDESVLMLKELKNQGVDCVVSTSHFYSNDDSPESFLERRAMAYELLKKNISSDMPKIVLGCEMQYYEGISLCEMIDSLKIENTNYILLEMPFQNWSERMLEDVISLKQDSADIILAHIERYLHYIPNGTLDILKKNGIIFQSNASFFNNFKTKRKALHMLQNGYIQLIGSDCHNMGSRAPDIGRAYELIEKKSGKEKIDEIEKTGRNLLQGLSH